MAHKQYEITKGGI